MAKAIPDIDLTVVYNDDTEDDVFSISPLAIIQTEKHLAKGFGEIFSDGILGDILYLGWRELRNTKPGESEVKFDKWVAKVADIDLTLNADEKAKTDDEGNPTE